MRDLPIGCSLSCIEEPGYEANPGCTSASVKYMSCAPLFIAVRDEALYIMDIVLSQEPSCPVFGEEICKKGN